MMNGERREADGYPSLCFLVNPASHSGKGMNLWKQAEHILKERGAFYQVFLSRKRGDIEAFARMLTGRLDDGAERTIVILGGDGTVNEALQGIRNFRQVRLGYIPTGSSNDLARDMGIGRNVEQTLLAMLDGGRERQMDLGCVAWKENGVCQKRYFLVSCGIGYDAAVCEEALSSRMKDAFNRVGLGKLTYLGIGLKQMFTIRYARAWVRLDGERTVHLKRMLFTASMLHRFEGGGFCFCPQADAQDGLLDLCVVDDVPAWRFPLIIPFALKGKHFRFRGVTHYRAARVDIRTSVPLWVQTDGEIPGKLDRIRVSCEKKKVRFIW